MQELLRDLNFYFNQFLDLYLFFIPLGILGIWRWGVWVFKKVTGSFYRPRYNLFKSKVSIVTPVYNEDPIVFRKALKSWAGNRPSEIIAIIDYSDEKSIRVFKDFAQEYPFSRLIITKTPGKRAALADGIEQAKEEIVALVDSDTIWDKDVIKNALPPFEDAKTAGVGTYQNVLSPKTVSQKIFDIQLDLRYSDDFPFLASLGNALICLSGRTAFYRRKIILPMLPELVNEKFMGRPVISGDDKTLTYLVLSNGYKVAFQSDSKVYTPGMESMSSFIKQRIRWSRNALRADLKAMWSGWTWKHKALAFFQIDKIFQAFAVILSPIYFFVSLFTGLWLPAIAIFVWWFVSRAVKIYPHLKRRPKDIFILPYFVFYSFLFAILKVYALFTLNTQGWITRWDKARLPELRFLTNATAYLGTILLIISFAVFVYIYKQYSYFIPLEQKQQLISSILPAVDNIPVSTSSESEVSEKDMVSKKYEMQFGESLGSVAEKFGVSTFNLLQANISRLTNWNEIEPGFVMSIPGKDVTFTSANKFNYERVYPDALQVVYEPDSNTIIISGRGEKITLSDIRERVGSGYLEEISPKVWQLRSNLFIRSGITMNLNKEEVEWLRLASSKDNYVSIRAFNGTIFVNGVKITSWDENKQDFDKDIKDGRSYILVKDGSRMDFYNSELAYLGFPRSPDMNVSPYGVSWRMSNGKLGTTLLTGEIIDSKFHHNYFGAYTFGATGMVWRGNEFFDNIKYGLDPHDDSNGFLVENNKFYNNGSMGLIFSKRCVDNIIRNNISYNNKLHGIMLHEKSDNNVIENNTIYGNTDGIAMWRSSRNIVRNNIIKDNKRGIRANVSSNENYIVNNFIENNLQYGIYLYEEANNNIFMNNTVKKSFSAAYIKSRNNSFVKNILEDNQIGVYLRDRARDNKFSENSISYNRFYGIYTKTPKGERNLLSLNILKRNRWDIMSR